MEPDDPHPPGAPQGEPPESSSHEPRSGDSNRHDARGPGARVVPGISDHQLLRRIGRGAYGEVWLARNVMGAFRAIKIVYRDDFDSDRPYEREFSGIQRFEPVSRSHESQVDILHVGRNDALRCFYYVMELADDVVLGSQIIPESYVPRTVRVELRRHGRFPAARAIEIGVALATAVRHLHGCGLIHRDIKPANVIFVNGLPKLADIGLVTESGATISFVGTEGYMPPEGPGTVQADIYSLGKTLYEVATGKDRFEFPELPTWTEEPRDAGDLFEFNEILLKACHPEKEQRYRDAEEMHADLVLLQAGKSIRRARAQEHRLVVLTRLLGGGLVVALLALGGYLVQRSQTREARRLQARAEDLSARLGVQNAESLFERGESAQALAHLARILRDNPTNRIAAERILAALQQRAYPRWSAPPIVVSGALAISRFSPNGERIATLTRDGDFQLWNVRSGHEFSALPASTNVTAFGFSDDGTRMVTANRGGSVLLRDGQTGQPLAAAWTHPDAVNDAAFSPDGSLIATACSDGHARILRVSTGGMVHTPWAGGTNVLRVVFSPDGGKLAMLTAGRTAGIWDVTHGEEAHRFKLGGRTSSIGFSPDGRLLAVAVQNPNTAAWEIRMWEVESGREFGKPLRHENRIATLAFSPDSRRLVTSTANNDARIWDVADGKLLSILRHSGIVVSAGFSPDGRHVVTASVDQTARLWDAETGDALSEAMRHEGRIVHAEFNRAGDRVLTASWDKTVKVWESRPGPSPAIVLPHSHWVTTAEFSATGGQAVTATASQLFTATRNNRWNMTDAHTLALWDTRSGQRQPAVPLPSKGAVVAAQFTAAGPLALVAEQNMTSDKAGRADPEFASSAQVWDVARRTPLGDPIQHAHDISCAGFSADGHRVAVGTMRGAIGLWDARKGTPLVPVLTHDGRINSVRFSPDGGRLISTSDAGTAMVWDTATGQPLFGPLRHESEVWFAQFSPEGSKIVTASMDNTARIWSSTGTLLTVLPHGGPLEFAEFSPDSTRVVTCSGNEARLWNVLTGGLITEPLTHRQLVHRAAFSPDGLRLVTASFDGTAQIWDAATGLKLGDPCRHHDRVVTAAFSPDGRTILTASLDGTARLAPVPILAGALPESLAVLAETVAGWRINPAGLPEPIPWADLEAARVRLAATPRGDPLASLVPPFATPPP